MIQCPSCGRENADNFNFCLDCGYDLKAYRETLAQPALGSAPAMTTSLDADSPTEPGMAPSEVGPSVSPLMPATSAAPPRLSAPTHLVPSLATAAASVAPVPSPGPAPASAPPAAVALTPAPPATGSNACPACQAQVPTGMKFCGSCGKRLEDNDEDAGSGASRTMFLHAADLQLNKEPLCKLVTIDQSGKEGMTFTIRSGETLCGRVNGIILFFDDPYVSPSHCLFAFHGGRLKVTDKQSLNGVYARIKGERLLSDGDLLRMGQQLFRFEGLGQAASQVQRTGSDDASIWGSPNPGAFGRLVQILEDGRTGEIRLLFGGKCDLGREHGDIVFPTDGFISGRHCSFYTQGDNVFVKDLGSSNGTYLRIRGEAPLLHGDFLLVGNQMLRVEIT